MLRSAEGTPEAVVRHVYPRNDDVIEAFAHRLPARNRSGTLVSDGERLLSYGWWEIARWHGDEAFVRDGPSYSMTAGQQRNAVGYALGWKGLSALQTPRTEARMLVARGNCWDDGKTSCLWLTKRPRRNSPKLDQLCVGCKRRRGLAW